MMIQDAQPADAAPCADIYGHYVRETAISFELEAPGAAVMAERIAAAQQTHAWLVARSVGSVLGYAYGGRFAQRAAYRWSAEVSIYLATDFRRAGLGRALYSVLFDRLAERGYRRLFAGMTLPNDRSEGLHRAMGFEPVGVLRSVGWKHGAWHDVAWMQRSIGSAIDPPVELH